MNELTLIGEPEVKEVPRFFDFKKRHFTTFHPEMPNLNYDPFPDKKDDDTVRTEIVSRQKVLRLKFKGSPHLANELQGKIYKYNGDDFVFEQIKIQRKSGECMFDARATAVVA